MLWTLHENIIETEERQYSPFVRPCHVLHNHLEKNLTPVHLSIFLILDVPPSNWRPNLVLKLYPPLTLEKEPGNEVGFVPCDQAPLALTDRS